MSFDLNILVNGSRCKQYYHQGKTFIEAKNGSEYVIEIKNNHYKRILAVGSVDSLNVLTGKTATVNDSGYIADAYSSERIKGFRFSDEEWAMFRFGYKFYGNTYAQSKEDGSEKNCGIIGMKFFYEKEHVVVYNNSPLVQWNVTPQWLASTPSTPPYPTYTISASYSAGPTFHGTGGYQSNVSYNCSNFNLQDMTDDYCHPIGDDSGATRGYTKSSRTKGGDTSHKLSAKVKSRAGGQSAQYSCASAGIAPPGLAYTGHSDLNAYHGNVEQPKAEFDMGTEWGRKERSRVNTIPFDKGVLAYSIDIYYASRKALIAMGVPIYTTLSSNLPQSFPDKYAQPPKGWVG